MKIIFLLLIEVNGSLKKNLFNLSILSELSLSSFPSIISFPLMVKSLPIVASPLNSTLKASDLLSKAIPFPMTKAVLLAL